MGKLTLISKQKIYKKRNKTDLNLKLLLNK
jgi:hypothetical protein